MNAEQIVREALATINGENDAEFRRLYGDDPHVLRSVRCGDLTALIRMLAIEMRIETTPAV